MFLTRQTSSRARRHSGHRRLGAAATELAVVFPVYLMIVFGIVEFGRAFSAQQMLNNAARLGARRSIVDSATNSAVEQAVKDACVDTLGISENDVTVTLNVETASGDPVVGNDLANSETGGMCSVTVAVPFSAVSILSMSYLTTAVLKGNCMMECE